jgi:predicted enzyme related to lactoylglutathione lyase
MLFLCAPSARSLCVSAVSLISPGGKVLRPADRHPGVGRFCVVNDPTGAAVSLITTADPA